VRAVEIRAALGTAPREFTGSGWTLTHHRRDSDGRDSWSLEIRATRELSAAWLASAVVARVPGARVLQVQPLSPTWHEERALVAIFTVPEPLAPAEVQVHEKRGRARSEAPALSVVAHLSEQPTDRRHGVIDAEAR